MKSMDPRDVCERLSEFDDGTGDLGVVVRQALADDPDATDDDIASIIVSAREAAEEEEQCGWCTRERPTTHMHGLRHVPDCAYAGRSYEADACSGDDLCDDCLSHDESR